jgi:glycosyltransferase involved in cell wall biosynthesis
MNNIKCGFVISFNGPYFSNFVASIISLEKNMQQRGIETVYIFPSEDKDFEWMRSLEGLTEKIYFIDYKPYSFDNYFKIKRILKKEKVNFIYSRMSGWDFSARFASPFLPVIWHMDMNVNVVNWKRRILNFIKFRFIGFGKTYHIAASIPVADAINTLKPKHRAKAILNSLDFSRLKAKNAHTIVEPYKLLIFGWLPEVKGLDTTLDAVEKLNEKETVFELLISSQPLTEEYINNRYKDDAPGFITLLPPSNNVSELYDEADIMISASRSESFSFCLAEAIYSGLPVVFSDIAGTSWAREFKNSYEFKTGDSEDLIRALNEVRNDITDEQLSFNRELMHRKYSLDSWSEKIIDYIMEIVKK